MFKASGSALPIPTARPFHRITTDRRLYDLVTTLATMGGWQEPDVKVAPLTLLRSFHELAYLATRYPLNESSLDETKEIYGRRLQPTEAWAYNVEWLCKEYLNHLLETAAFTLPFEQAESLTDYDRRLFVRACSIWARALRLKDQGKELESRITRAAVGVLCEDLARKYLLGEMRANATQDAAKYQSRVARTNQQKWTVSVQYVSGHFFGDTPL